MAREYREMVERAYSQHLASLAYRHLSNEEVAREDRPSVEQIEASYPAWFPYGQPLSFEERARVLGMFFRSHAPHILRAMPLRETYEVAVPLRVPNSRSKAMYLHARMLISRDVAERLDRERQWGGRHVHLMSHLIPGYNHRVMMISAAPFPAGMRSLDQFMRYYPFPSVGAISDKWRLFIKEYFDRDGV